MLTIDALREAIPGALKRTDLPVLGEREEGKVRDIYRVGDKRVLVTSDRVSAFDRVLGTIPYKGQVLNQLSAWWFKNLEDVVSHHMVAVPDPNVMITHEADPLMVEVIVRGYITGSTSTSLWTLYEQGVDKPYGLELPKGLKKNTALPEAVITPTTKAARGEHDERLTCAEVVEKGLVDPELWEKVQNVALTIFKRGQDLAHEAGLILVDTKYEFGMVNGELCLIDEVHTPDSSRYWVASKYAEAMAEGRKPQQHDKEHLRLWLGDQGYKGEGPIPPLDPDVVSEVARRYIDTFERLTGETFVPGDLPAAPRIAAASKHWF
jgi:phosphoribosylaminoimidazole-succinocarboxamide synthase